MLVCNVSLRPPRRAISSEIAEATTAADATATGNIVFATLVDDPASVGEAVDAYLGEIMLEAASAGDVATCGFDYAASVNEAATAGDIQDGTAAVAYATLNGTATNVTMSNGNLTATHPNTLGAGVVSTSLRATGKFYFESTIQVSLSTSNGMGILLSGGTVTDGTAHSTTVMIALGAGNSIIFANGSSSGINFGSTGVGDIWSAAVDLAAHLIWFRKNAGTWNNSGTANPATGVGGVSFTAGTYAPWLKFVNASNNTDVMTANFGSSAFANAAPVGFVGWPA